MKRYHPFGIPLPRIPPHHPVELNHAACGPVCSIQSYHEGRCGTCACPMLSVDSFRAWPRSPPEEEHWKPIEGVPLMTPPNRRHQQIVWNLENLLNEALNARDPTLEACHDIGVNIVAAVRSAVKAPSGRNLDAQSFKPAMNSLRANAVRCTSII